MLNTLEHQKGLRRITGEPGGFVIEYDDLPTEEGSQEEEEEEVTKPFFLTVTYCNLVNMPTNITTVTIERYHSITVIMY
jgi:hypothetical protein